MQDWLAQAEEVSVLSTSGRAVALGDAFLVDGELDVIVDLGAKDFLGVFEPGGQAQGCGVGGQALQEGDCVCWLKVESASAVGVAV